jgi:hypothetical protein
MKLKMDEATALILYRIIGALDVSDAGLVLLNEDLDRAKIHGLFARLEDKLIERGHDADALDGTHYTYTE